MKQDIWCIRNEADEGTVSASGAAQGFGPDRVTDPRMGKAWRPLTTLDTLTVALQGPRAIVAIAVTGPDFTPGPNFSLRIGSSVGASDIRAGAWSPVIDHHSKTAFWIAERDNAGVIPQVSEIQIGTNGLDIGRVWAAEAHWRPKYNHVSGATQQVDDLSNVQIANRSGAVFTDTARRIRRHEVGYEAIQVDEWDGPVRDLALLAGTHKQLMFIPDHDFYPPERHAIIGYQETLNPIAAMIWRRFEQGFVLREAG